jgi:hypothetical protein
MRSLKYILTGNPQNLDDCLHLALRESPLKVYIRLTTEEVINPKKALKMLIAKVLWRFPSRSVEYEKTFGGCLAHESEDEQKEIIDNARKKFNKYLARIEKIVPEIEVRGQFDYSMIYKFFIIQRTAEREFLPY